MKVADVTVEQLHDYEVKLSAVRSEAGNYFKKLVREQDLFKHGEEAQKSAIYHAAVKAVNSFSDAAGSAACDFFDAHVTGAQPSSIAPQPWFIKRRLYENIEKYAKTHKLGDDEFMRLLAEEVGGEVVQHANRTTIHNAVKNNLRYARVPFGNSCAFCLMLASRGFVYKTETTAGEDKGHYHARCRCKIVAGKKDTKIGDHNPEKLNQRMMQIAKELDITNFNWEDYISDKTIQDLLQQEVRLRDKDWLLTGKVPKYTQEANARPLQKEKDIADKLSSRGIKCEFRATSLEDSKRTSDIFILADKLKKPYEFKTPTGAGKQTIYHQFESAAGQAKCMVLDISKLHENWGEERVKSEVSKKINWHYKTKDKKDWQFDEVRIINSKGEMKIIKKARPPV